MVMVHFQVDDFDYQQFKMKVGPRNVSSTIRNFIKSNIGEDDKKDKEYVLRRRLQKAKEEKDRVDSEYTKLKAKIDLIDQKKMIEEEKHLKYLEEQKKNYKDMKYNTMKSKLSEVV